MYDLLIFYVFMFITFRNGVCIYTNGNLFNIYLFIFDGIIIKLYYNNVKFQLTF